MTIRTTTKVPTTIWAGVTCILLAGAAAGGCGTAARPVQQIGVYESRAIAVAWAASPYNTQVEEMTAEYKRAEAAGDKSRMVELKKKASKRQDALHQQGFGRAPVDDLLVPIRDRIPAICQAAGVDRIVPIWSREAAGKAAVDVTDQLVAEYKPSEKTLRTIAELRKHPPIIGPIHCD